MVRSALLSTWALAAAWDVPQQGSECPAERELLVRYTKGLDARGDDSFRLTLLSNTLPNDVKLDRAPLGMTSPRPIELNGQLTTNPEVIANWSSLQHKSSTFNVSSISNLHLTTDCGESLLTVRNPGRGQGHVSVVFGDPFYGGKHFAEGPYVNISRLLPQMINYLAEFESVHSLGVLGDFWYELSPIDSLLFNRHLTTKSKSLMTYSVMGNHDYWQTGSPLNDEDVKDGRFMTDFAHGYGWTQFWGQDTIGVWNNERQGQEPYDGQAFLEAMPKLYADKAYSQQGPVYAVPQDFSSSHFVHGNMGYILLSGVWHFDVQKRWIANACNSMEREDITSIWLVGHWSEDIHNPSSEGWEAHASGGDLSTRRVFDLIAQGQLGTDSPCYTAYQAGQLKFVNGHDHFNDCVKDQVVLVDGINTIVCAGWQVSGIGKGPGGTLDGTLPENQTTIACPQCDLTEFTFGTLDTRNDMLRFGFLQLVSNMTDRTEDWQECFKQMDGDFSFDFIIEHCQGDESLPLLHVWSQPLRKLFGSKSQQIVV